MHEARIKADAGVQHHMWIGGEWRESVSGDTMAVSNPATGESLGAVPRGDDRDIELAAGAALRAFPEWYRSGPRERAQCLCRLAAKLRSRAEEFAQIDVVDSGNPIRSMRQDALRACEATEYMATIGIEMKGESQVRDASFHWTTPEPFGVVARIIPFNHPFLFAAGKIAAPLMAGNTVILKPGDQTPLSALALAEASEGILPPGVLNVVTGDGPVTGAALVRDARVQRIAFTGSVETGKRILRLAAEGIKTVTLELGGKNPLIIFPDADIHAAAQSAVLGMNFRLCQGQSCGSTSRLFVHESVAEKLVPAILDQVGRIRIGLPIREETEMGCLVSQAQYEKCLYYIETGLKEGARLRAGGSKPSGAEFEKGHFLSPTVFDQVRPEMKIAREEIFGPVLSILTWSDYDALLREVNGLVYGLTASVWTRNAATALRAARDIQSGYVWINESSRHYPGMPFGGYKQSGIGREESLAELLSYTQNKAIHMNLSQGWNSSQS